MYENIGDIRDVGEINGDASQEIKDQPNSTQRMVNRAERGWTLARTIDSGDSQCIFNHISGNENISIGNAAGALGDHSDVSGAAEGTGMKL